MLQGALPVFSTGLFRTDILREIGGFDEENFRFYEDLDTPIRLALAGRFGFIDASVICRRQHETNISTSTSHIRVEKVFWYAKLLRMSEMVPYRALVRKQLRRSVLKLMQVLGQQKKELGERELTALRMGWQYAFHDPRILFYLLKLRIPIA
jgi:GT2 family glycosyltransferase